MVLYENSEDNSINPEDNSVNNEEDEVNEVNEKTDEVTTALHLSRNDEPEDQNTRMNELEQQLSQALRVIAELKSEKEPR